MRSFLPAILAVLPLVGCLSSRQGVVRTASPWKVGETTRKDVVATWGNPDFIAGDDWVWWDVESIGGKLRVAYMGLGVTVANVRRGMREFRLRFGSDGRLSSMDATETMPGGARWSLFPD